MSKSSFTYNLIFGSVAALLLSTFAFYHFDFFGWFKKKTKVNPQISNEVRPTPSKEIETSSFTPAIEEQTLPPKSFAAASTAFTVEDASDDDDDEEEEETEEAESNDPEIARKKEEEKKRLEALKEQYESAVSKASKYMKSEKTYPKALEEFTTALNLAEGEVKVSSHALLALYNNRSAMFEKLKDLNNSLLDIKIVLELEPLHSKARLRKARVLDAQHKHREALEAYMFSLFLEQTKGDPTPPSIETQKRIEENSRVLACEISDKALLTVSLGGSESTVLPSPAALTTKLLSGEWVESCAKKEMPVKSYCRNFVESFPSYYLWVEQAKTINREELEAKIATLPEESTPAQVLKAHLDLIHFDLAQGAFVQALNTNLLAIPVSAYSPLSEDQPECTEVSQAWELIGSSLHLRCLLPLAQQAYFLALKADADNFEVSLKLASSYLEQGNRIAAMKIYNELIDKFQQAHSALKEEEDAHNGEAPDTFRQERVTLESNLGWVLTHRATMWVTRDKRGEYDQYCCDRALRDLNTALKLVPAEALELRGDETLEEVARISSLKFMRVTVLIKKINLYGHNLPAARNSRSASPVPTIFSGLSAEQIQEEAEKEALLGGSLPAVSISSADFTVDPEQEQLLVKGFAEEVKTLDPDNESLKSLDMAESAEADPEEMIKKADSEIESQVEPSVFPYLSKAGALTQMGVAHLQMQDIMKGQIYISQAMETYNKALEIEKNSLEACTQLAQLKSFIGDIPGCVEVLENSLHMIRARDEALDIASLLVTSRAQLKAAKEMQELAQARR